MEFVFIALKIEIVPLFSCNKDIESHKSTCKFTGPEDEVGLIFLIANCSALALIVFLLLIHLSFIPFTKNF